MKHIQNLQYQHVIAYGSNSQLHLSGSILPSRFSFYRCLFLQLGRRTTVTSGSSKAWDHSVSCFSLVLHPIPERLRKLPEMMVKCLQVEPLHHIVYVTYDNAVPLHDNIVISLTDRKKETLNEQLMILQSFMQ